MRLMHELPIYINKDSEILFLGSFPSIKSREANFYYSHPRNRFFKVLYSLFNEQYSEDIENRKCFLRKHKIALYDVVYECDIDASYDSSIKNVIPIDIESILSKFPNIQAIATTGSLARKLFDKYLLNKIDSNRIRIIYLPSTSPANAKMSDEVLLDHYKKILEI